jgi:mono/diheme cytochrome c family protein
VRHGLGGYGGMPAISRDSVSDRNVNDIAAYLMSLGPAPASTESTNAVAASANTVAATASGPAPAASSATAGGGDAAHGGTVFAANCASCHGAAGQGGFGPSLKNEKSRKDLAAAVRWIKDPAPPMPKLYPSPLSEKDVSDVAAFVESL